MSATKPWRDNPEIVTFRTKIGAHFAQMSDEHLARQAGTILEVDQMERGEVPNATLAGDYRVQKICQGLLSNPLKPEDERGLLEMDRTRIGREVCVDEFLRRVVCKYADRFGFVKAEEGSVNG